MHIFITGVTGYLGRSLASHLVTKGHTVSGSSRREGVRLELGQPVNPRVFENVDVVIHAAHDFQHGAMQRNVEGTRAIFNAAKTSTVRRQMFLSSYSARADSRSEYGQTKYRTEQTFLDNGEVVLRPGLVVGNGGLFARQRIALLRTPVVPIIGNGAWPTAVIAIQHFLDATEALLLCGQPGDYALFYDERPTMRQFVTAIKTHAGQRFLFLPLPSSLAATLVRVARSLGIEVPADPDQIKALQLSHTAPWRSDLPALLPGREAEFSLHYAMEKLSTTL